MNTIFKGILALVIVLGAGLVTLPVQGEEDLQATGSENAESGVAEELVPEGIVEEKVPLREEGEAGEITERGVPRIKLSPRPRINIQEQSPPRITIPQKPRPTFKIPSNEVPPGKATGRPQPEPGNFIPNQVIVKLRPGMTLPLSTMKKFGLQEVRRTSGEHILFRFAVPPGMEQIRNPLTVAEELAKHVAVLFAQPNRIYLPDQVPEDERHPQDPLFLQQWHFLENGTGPKQSPGGIGLPKVWKRTVGSRNVVVAVLDTGIIIRGKDKGTIIDHPDILGTGNRLPGFDFISDLKRANDGNGRDADPTDPGDGTGLGDCIPGVKGAKDTWHGNNVAGVIGLAKTNNTEGIAGVNWLVNILPVRVSGKCGADDIDLYDAIKWSAGLPVPDAPLNQNPARIINISLGSIGLCDRLTQEAIDEVVTKKGVSVVAGAGNNSGPAMFHSPANCQNVIAVAASDEQGRLAFYSNFGPPVLIMAPGGDSKRDVDKDGTPDGVLTLNHPVLQDPNTTQIPAGYEFVRGTSLAAPHVSGVLALWLAVDPTLTHAELVKGLQDNAFPRNSAQCPRSCGAGLLNANHSSLIQPGKPVPPPPGKKEPPPKEPPPPVAQCTIKTTDIVHSLKIDIGNNDSQTTSAKQSLFRMLIHGDVEARRDASGMVKATENGTLAGIFQRNKGPVAARGQRMTPQKGWWELIPQGQLGMCLKEPKSEFPMIIYREQEMSTSQLDTMLRQAWHQCDLPALPFPCVYQKDLGNKPQSKACLDQAEKAYLEGEKQCDAKFSPYDRKACSNAYDQCLQKKPNNYSACQKENPCAFSQVAKDHFDCMKPFEEKRKEAQALCEE